MFLHQTELQPEPARLSLLLHCRCYNTSNEWSVFLEWRFLSLVLSSVWMLHSHWVVEESSMEGCLLGRIQTLQWVCKPGAEGPCTGKDHSIRALFHSSLNIHLFTRCILCWVDFWFDPLWLSLCSAAIYEKHDCKWGSVVPKQFLEWQTCQQFLEQNFYRNLLNFVLFWKKMSPQVSLWGHSITQHLDEESLPGHISKSTSRKLATRLCFTPP